MTTYSTKKSARLAARLAEIQAEQEAHEQRLEDAYERAGRARVALIEDLLERFEVPPAEPEPRRNKRTGVVIRGRDGSPRTVDPNPDEAERMQRLAAAIDEAVSSASAASSPTPQPSPTPGPKPVATSGGDSRAQGQPQTGAQPTPRAS